MYGREFLLTVPLASMRWKIRLFGATNLLQFRERRHASYRSWYETGVEVMKIS